MKITLDMLQKEKVEFQELFLYNKLKLQDVDLDNKEITIYDWENIDKLRWLVKKFKLTTNINYIDLNEDHMFFKYRNGLLVCYENGHRYYKIFTYNNGLLIDTLDSNGYKTYYEYNKDNLLIRKHYNSKYGHDIITYKYNENKQLIELDSFNKYDNELYIYNSDGLIEHYQRSDGFKSLYIYKDKLLISYKCIDEYECKYTYNDNGLLTHVIDIDGYEEFYTYENNLLINFKEGEINYTFHYDNNILIDITTDNDELFHNLTLLYEINNI